MKILAQKIHQFTNTLGNVVSIFNLILVLLFCFDVIVRYIFKHSSVAMFELEWHVFAFVFLMGAGYTLQHDKHVRVDVFYAQYSARQKAWLNIFGTVFFLIPFCLLMIDVSAPYVWISYKLTEHSADLDGLPYRFIVKSFILLGFVGLFIQSIAYLMDNILMLNHSKKS